MTEDSDDVEQPQLAEALKAIENARQTGATDLDLSALDLDEVPIEVRALTRLETLDLGYNQLSSLPDWITELSGLRRLDLGNNEFGDFPEEVLVFNRLEYLNISENNIPELPVDIGKLEQLRDLLIWDNPLESLPDAIGDLKNLESLEADWTGLQVLPLAISRLTSLKRLELSGNGHTKLPQQIGNLKELEVLKLHSNELTILPPSVGQLTLLHTLYLGNNRLRSLPVALNDLRELRKLDLSGNQFTDVPGTIRGLTKLTTLNVSRNRLTEIPEWINEFTQLNELLVSHNFLKGLPAGLNGLTSLTNLKANNNELAELPRDIGEFPKLETLDLSANQLMELPETLNGLKSLRVIYLHGNDALGIPAEILGPPASDYKARPSDAGVILDYYARLRAGKRPLNEAKLILVGRGAAGKTSIVNRLVHDVFKDEKKTEGITITDWKLRLHGSEEVRLNIWDFGGQEIMHATHQFFLTQRSLYLLVLNGREGGEDMDADYWLKLIESFGGDSPVLVILNKIKQHPFDINRQALRQKYPAIREVIKTDCEDGTGIKQLRKSIERETDQLESLRDPFPAAWFSIKNKLAATKKNYLSFEEYQKVCANLGERDPESQELLTTYLHRLGVALNYKDDPRLRDTHVLNPRWVTNGIYKILNAKKLEKQKGEIRLTDLPKILDANEYPVSMHRFLFDLMKKFELCFSFPDDDARYLIPELLDKQQPPEADEFTPEQCLNFQYHYPVLPEGLLPRFIVRTHVLSERLQRWRTGVIMEFEGCRALVKADVQDRKVFISVAGPPAGRRRLLAVIRSDFESIHHNIRNLQAEEMVPVPDHTNLVIPYKKLQVLEKGDVRKFKEVSGEMIIELDVEELLNGVNLDTWRGRDRLAAEYREEPCRLFYSYSHKDEGLRNELDTHLKLMQRQGVIQTWYDRRINPGDDFERRIDENLELADIVLLLVSSDFMASDYCYEKEMDRALERHKNGEARVIPVIVRDVNWSKAPFAKLLALPKNGRAVELWPNKDSAWRNVAEGIETVASSIKGTRRLQMH